MPESVDELLTLLDLEEIEVGLFRARQPRTSLQRVFGGQVLAQALMAATRTVPADRTVHSLHGYFLVAGRPDLPIVYDVELVRDGGSFSSRRVVARQSGQVMFYLSASFHVHEDGYEHADPAPEAPAPEDSPRLTEVLAELTGRSASGWQHEWGAIDVRYVGDSRPGGAIEDPAHPARARAWVRVAGELPDDPVLHQAVLAYTSDLTLIGVSVVPHGVVIGYTVQAASLDHAMWFHRPFRADRWLLYDQVSPSASGALGLATGRLFQDGRLVATVAQEGLLRPLRDHKA
ncbi:MAG: acyl-CoA thioesterase [Janthinobacterium lividum]